MRRDGVAADHSGRRAAANHRLVLLRLLRLHADKVVVAEVAESDNTHRLDLATLWISIRTPRWLLGLSFMGLSLVCQITALSFAPVSVVQPVGVLAFPWSMIIQSGLTRCRSPVLAPRRHRDGPGHLRLHQRRRLQRGPRSRLERVQRFDRRPSRLSLRRLAGRPRFAGARQWRCLFWGASGGAVFYGLEAYVVKSLMEFAKQDAWTTSPAFWGTLVALVIGSATAGWMVAAGVRDGPAELVVAAMTITSPSWPSCSDRRPG